MSAKFSDRMGITTPPPLQIDSISEPLKVALWNEVMEKFLNSELKWRPKFKPVYKHLLWRIDHIPYTWSDAKNNVGRWFFNKERKWYEIYNFVEFLVVHTSLGEYYNLLIKRYSESFNYILEKENSGYRFIAGKFAPITNQEEIETIQSIASISDHKLAGVRTHISTAIDHLSQKPNPDYRNCIKESISAVESAAKIISGNDKGELKSALNKLNEHFPIHGAMREGFLKLYGWTSDDDGIRHALLDEPNVGFDEAKFMLVACSAFVHYLITKANEAELL